MVKFFFLESNIKKGKLFIIFLIQGQLDVINQNN